MLVGFGLWYYAGYTRGKTKVRIKERKYEGRQAPPPRTLSKGTVRGNFKNPKLFSALIDQNDGSSYLEKIITLYVYRMQGNGEIKKIGTPLTGKAVDIKVPNY